MAAERLGMTEARTELETRRWCLLNPFKHVTCNKKRCVFVWRWNPSMLRFEKYDNQFTGSWLSDAGPDRPCVPVLEDWNDSVSRASCGPENVDANGRPCDA